MSLERSLDRVLQFSLTRPKRTPKIAKSKMFKFFQKIFLIYAAFLNFLSGQFKQRTQNKGPSSMRMPLLPIPFHPAMNSLSRPRARGVLLGLVAGATSLSLGTLCAQSDAEMNQLKAQMQQMQQDYEKRLASMESQVKSMQNQVALTASIAKSRTITGPDGKAVAMEGPVLMPPLDTFTRNFKFHTYF